MAIPNGVLSTESVSAGHPDKFCDRISDAILDALMTLDAFARVACEVMATSSKILVGGELATCDRRHIDEIENRAEAIVRQVLAEVGYDQFNFDFDGAEIETRFTWQNPEIAAAVNGAVGAPSLGAGDQGMMFGYATDETPSLMPKPWVLATELVARAQACFHSGASLLKADGKSQVSVRYAGGRSVDVETVVLSWQHQQTLNPLEDVRDYLVRNVIEPLIPGGSKGRGPRIIVNPAGPWHTGGPQADTGLTGRKIIVDTYGGACPHGGGAFSGKDPTKVDRSAAYMARYLARHVVAGGLARRCTVQLAYAIGRPDPVSVGLDFHGTGELPEAVVALALRDVFDLTPSGIIAELDLRRPIYKATSSLGHFGPFRDPKIHLWENNPKTAELADAVTSQLARRLNQRESSARRRQPQVVRDSRSQQSLDLQATSVADGLDRIFRQAALTYYCLIRVAPEPSHWAEFHQQLKRFQTVDGPPPPVPMILAGHSSPLEDKRNCLTGQIAWASETGCLSIAETFLKALGPDDWQRVPSALEIEGLPSAASLRSKFLDAGAVRMVRPETAAGQVENAPSSSELI